MKPVWAFIIAVVGVCFVLVMPVLIFLAYPAFIFITLFLTAWFLLHMLSVDHDDDGKDP